jgi:hypothetical protein
MQLLEPGLYEAKWGSYRMMACIRPPKRVLGYELKRSCGELIVVHDDLTETSVLQCINTDGPGLIRSFVDYMEKHGLVAVVNGEKRDLADFLVFEPVARVLH